MRVVRIVKSLLIAAVLLAGIGLVGLLVVLPRATGTIPLTVYTGSMEPTIAQGGLVLIEPVHPTTLEPGDVITYQVAPDVDEYITHRIVRIQPETTPPSFITKGDANRGEDQDPVPVGAVRGEVWFDVPYVGTMSEFVSGKRGIAVVAVVTGLLLTVHLLQMAFRRREDEADETDVRVADDGSSDVEKTLPTRRWR